MQIIIDFITNLFRRLDAWDIVGFAGQAVFFSRFLVQWIATERKRRTVIPVAFWYLSMGGALITLIYSIHVGKLVFILAFSLSMVIYVRNLYIWYARRTRRRGLLFASDSPPNDSPKPPSEN